MLLNMNHLDKELKVLMMKMMKKNHLEINMMIAVAKVGIASKKSEEEEVDDEDDEEMDEDEEEFGNYQRRLATGA